MKALLPSAPAARILIVDDEPHVRKFVRLTLQAEGFNVLEAGTAEQAITIVHGARPDLMILDLGLPDLDGQQVIRDVRMVSDMPILVLSGRTEDSEKIAAIDHGADDYIVKPFATKHLAARVRAALQQTDLRRADARGSRAHVQTGDLTISLNAQTVTRRDQPIPLEEKEYALLRLLALHGGQVLTAGHIENVLWSDRPHSSNRRAVQNHIGALRRKLEAEPAFPRYIVTEPAVGYRLEILPPADPRSV